MVMVVWVGFGTLKGNTGTKGRLDYTQNQAKVYWIKEQIERELSILGLNHIAPLS